MNSKERVDAAMHHQPVDRTPFAFVDAGAWASQTNGKSYDELYHLPDGGASVFVDTLKQFEPDIVSGVNGVFTAYLNAFGCKINTTNTGSPVNTEACLKSPEDIDKLDITTVREQLLANDFVQCMLRQCENIKKLVGDEKYVLVDIAGPFTAANVMYGTAEFMVLTMRNKAAANKLMEFATAASIEIFRLLREHGADIAFIAEPCASGTMISPKMMKQFVIPGYAKLKEAVDYKYWIAHICGGSGNRAEGLAEAGLNAFSCDYMVDLDQVFAAGQEQDRDLIPFGNINPAGAVMMGTPEETYEEAMAALKKANGRSMILATGCDLASTAPAENILMIPKAVKDMANA